MQKESCLRQITLTQGDGWSLVNRGLRSMTGNRKKDVVCVCVCVYVCVCVCVCVFKLHRRWEFILK